MKLKNNNQDGVLIFQKNSEETNFDKTNNIFFEKMPIFFPVKSKKTDKIIIKQLTYTLLLQNILTMNKNQFFIDFNKAILENSLNEFNEKFDIFIENVYFKREGDFTDKNFPELDLLNSDFLEFMKEEEKEISSLKVKNIKTKIIRKKKDDEEKKGKKNKKEEENLEAKNANNSEEINSENLKNIKEKTEKEIKKEKRQKEIEEKEKLFKPILMSELLNNTKFLEFKKMEADETLKNYSESFIYCDGFIKAKDYETKAEILKSSAGVFGLHILGKKDINLSDADFIHYCTLSNKNPDEEMTYNQFIKHINDLLKLNNYPGHLLELPKNISKINFANEIFPYGEKVTIRFNSYNNFKFAFKILNGTASVLVKLNIY